MNNTNTHFQIARELYFLADLACLNPIGAIAFGPSNSDDLSVKDYLFEIYRNGPGLVLVVDFYTWNAGGDQPDFDLDQWEDQKIEFTAPGCTRHHFKELSKVGRALLSGRIVELPDGTQLQFQRSPA